MQPSALLQSEDIALAVQRCLRGELHFTGGQATELTDWPTLRPGGSVLSFGEDAAGELYVLSSSGGVFKLIPAQ